MRELYSTEFIKKIINTYEVEVEGYKSPLVFFAANCFFQSTFFFLSQKILHDLASKLLHIDKIIISDEECDLYYHNLASSSNTYVTKGMPKLYKTSTSYLYQAEDFHSMSGWNQLGFLKVHTLFLLYKYIQELHQKTQPEWFLDYLAKELATTVNAYHILDYCQHIDFTNEEKSKDQIAELVNIIFNYTHSEKMVLGDELVFPCGIQKAHAIYYSLIKRGNTTFELRTDNAGVCSDAQQFSHEKPLLPRSLDEGQQVKNKVRMPFQWQYEFKDEDLFKDIIQQYINYIYRIYQIIPTSGQLNDKKYITENVGKLQYPKQLIQFLKEIAKKNNDKIVKIEVRNDYLSYDQQKGPNCVSHSFYIGSQLRLLTANNAQIAINKAKEIHQALKEEERIFSEKGKAEGKIIYQFIEVENCAYHAEQIQYIGKVKEYHSQLRFEVDIRNAFKENYLKEDHMVPSYLPGAGKQKLENYFVKLTLKRHDLLENSLPGPLLSAPQSVYLSEETFTELNEIFPVAMLDNSGILKGPTRQLLMGTAGSGKTTFCQYTAWRWAQPSNSAYYAKELSESYFLVIKIRLKRLLIDKYKSIYKKHASNIRDSMAEVIYEECLSQKQKDMLLEKFSCEEDELRNKVVEFIKRKVFNVSTGKPFTLFLLDGLDEVLNLLEQKNISRVGAILDYLTTSKHLHVFFTSRPILSLEKIKDFCLDRLLENNGFQPWYIKEYIQRYFKTKPEKGKSLIAQLNDYPKINTLIQTPLMLVLVCEIWEIQADQLNLPAYNELIAAWNKGVTGLYQQLMQCFLLRSSEGVADSSNMPSRVTRKFLATDFNKQLGPLRLLALQGTRENICEFSPTLQNKIIDQCNVDKSEQNRVTLTALEKTGLIRRIGYSDEEADAIPHEFLHLTFQEWLTAWTITLKFESDSLSKEDISELIENRYNRKWEWIWRFVVGLLYSKDGLGTIEDVNKSTKAQQRFWHLVFSSPRDYSGFGQMQLLAVCLEELSFLEAEPEILPSYASWKENWINIVLGEGIPKLTPFINALRYSLSSYPELQAALTKEVLRRVESLDSNSKLEIIILLPLSDAILIRDESIMSHVLKIFNVSTDIDHLMLAIKFVEKVGYLCAERVLNKLIECAYKRELQDIGFSLIRCILTIIKGNISGDLYLQINKKIKAKEKASLSELLQKLLQPYSTIGDLKSMSNFLSEYLIYKNNEDLPNLLESEPWRVLRPLTMEVLNALFSDVPEVSANGMWALPLILPEFTMQYISNQKPIDYLAQILLLERSDVNKGIDKEHRSAYRYMLCVFFREMENSVTDYKKWYDKATRIEWNTLANLPIFAYFQLKYLAPKKIAPYFLYEHYIEASKQFKAQVILNGLIFIDYLQNITERVEKRDAINLLLHERYAVCWLLEKLKDWLIELGKQHQHNIIYFLNKKRSSKHKNISEQALKSLLAFASFRYIDEYLIECVTDYYLHVIISSGSEQDILSFREFTHSIPDYYRRHLVFRLIIERISNFRKYNELYLRLIEMLPVKDIEKVLGEEKLVPVRWMTGWTTIYKAIDDFSHSFRDSSEIQKFSTFLSLDSLPFEEIKFIIQSMSDGFFEIDDERIHQRFLSILLRISDDAYCELLGILQKSRYIQEASSFSLFEKVCDLFRQYPNLRRDILLAIVNTINLATMYAELDEDKIKKLLEKIVSLVEITHVGPLNKEVITALYAALFRKNTSEKLISQILSITYMYMGSSKVKLEHKLAISLSVATYSFKCLSLDKYYCTHDRLTLREFDKSSSEKDEVNKLFIIKDEDAFKKALDFYFYNTKLYNYNTNLIKERIKKILKTVHIYNTTFQQYIWEAILNACIEHNIYDIRHHIADSVIIGLKKAYDEMTLDLDGINLKMILWRLLDVLSMNDDTVISLNQEKLFSFFKKEITLTVKECALVSLLRIPAECLKVCSEKELIWSMLKIIAESIKENHKVDDKFYLHISNLLTQENGIYFAYDLICFFINNLKFPVAVNNQFINCLELAYKALKPADVFYNLFKSAFSVEAKIEIDINFLLSCPDVAYIMRFFADFLQAGGMIAESTIATLKNTYVKMTCPSSILIRVLLSIYEIDRQMKAKADITKLIGTYQDGQRTSEQLFVQTVLYQHLPCVWDGNEWVFNTAKGNFSLESKDKYTLLIPMQQSIGFFRRCFIYQQDEPPSKTKVKNKIIKGLEYSYEILLAPHSPEKNALIYRDYLTKCPVNCLYLTICGDDQSGSTIDFILEVINRCKALRFLRLKDTKLIDEDLYKIIRLIPRTVPYKLDLINNKMIFRDENLIALLSQLKYLKIRINAKEGFINRANFLAKIATANPFLATMQQDKNEERADWRLVRRI